jgi:hypothetical protein
MCSVVNFGQHGTSNYRRKPESFQLVSHLWFIVLSWIQTFPGDVSWRFWHRDINGSFLLHISLCQGPKPAVFASRKKTIRCFVVGPMNILLTRANFSRFNRDVSWIKPFPETSPGDFGTGISLSHLKYNLPKTCFNSSKAINLASWHT